MSYKSILTLTVAVVFLGVAGLSGSVFADEHEYNRGGHYMGDKLVDEDDGMRPGDNVAYDNGDGNDGENEAGEWVDTDVTDPCDPDCDPAEWDADAAQDLIDEAQEALDELVEDALDVSD